MSCVISPWKFNSENSFPWQGGLLPCINSPINLYPEALKRPFSLYHLGNITYRRSRRWGLTNQCALDPLGTCKAKEPDLRAKFVSSVLFRSVNLFQQEKRLGQGVAMSSCSLTQLYKWWDEPLLDTSNLQSLHS